MPNVIEYGVRKPTGSDFDRRPNHQGETGASYKFDTQKSAKKASGNAATQVKGIKNQKGGNSFGSPKGKVSSFGGATGGKATQQKGFGAAVKGRSKS